MCHPARTVGRVLDPISGPLSMTSRTLAELAQLCGAVVDGDPALTVEGPAALADAGPREISFLANPRYVPQLATTKAGAVVVARDCASSRADLVLLRCDDPNRAFTAVIEAFAPRDPAPAPGVHPSAVVAPDAHVDPSASVGPNCTIASGARVGARSLLVAGVSIGREAQVGEDCVLHPAVVLYARVRVGDRVLMHAGTVLGADGFGFEPTRTGWTKIPQCGTVIIEDDVEIGANVTIDRARFGATRIGRGVKIDNLVQVGHNVVIGDGALVIAQVGIGGSTRIGKRVILAGQTGVTGHTTIGDGARIGARSGVESDVPAGADYFGSPARPRVEALRAWSLATRLPEMRERIKDLERRLGLLDGRATEKETR